jgi:hypothetical protein
MNIYPQQTAIHLPEDQFLELVLVQWHTPIPGVGQKIEDRVKAEKAGVLQGLGSEIGGMCGEDGHPVFVVIPELSLPVAHIELIEELLNDANVPIVVIAGFEFMSWQEYDEVARQFSNTPQIEICHQNLQANTFVNTAGIWIKELCNDGTWAVRRYIQSKLWPSDLKTRQRGSVSISAFRFVATFALPLMWHSCDLKSRIDSRECLWT